MKFSTTDVNLFQIQCSKNPVSGSSRSSFPFCDPKTSIGIIFRSSHRVRHLSHGANEGQDRAALRNESGRRVLSRLSSLKGRKKVHRQINELRRREARKELARLVNWHRDGGGSKSIAGGGADKDHGFKQRDRRPSRSPLVASSRAA